MENLSYQNAYGHRKRNDLFCDQSSNKWNQTLQKSSGASFISSHQDALIYSLHCRKVSANIPQVHFPENNA